MIKEKLLPWETHQHQLSSALPSELLRLRTIYEVLGSSLPANQSERRKFSKVGMTEWVIAMKKNRGQQTFKFGVEGSGSLMLRGKALRIIFRICMQLGGMTSQKLKWKSHKNSGKSCSSTSSTLRVPLYRKRIFNNKKYRILVIWW